MPTYLYECDVHGTFEHEHSIKEVLEDCPKCTEEKLDPPCKLKRLISATNFILSGGGWSKDNYS